MAYDKDKVFDDICDRIINGEALSKILIDDDMPKRTAFYEWLDNDDDKANKYTCACARRAEYHAEEIIEIADNKDEDPQRSRLKMDARKWHASKMNPKKYGDKSSVDLTTKGESITDKTQDLSGLSTEDLKTFEELQSKIEKK